MSLTGIVKHVFQSRQKDLERHEQEPLVLQDAVWHYLVKEARDTEFGRKHLFSTFKSYDDWAQHVPVSNYEDLKGSIDRMRHGEQDVLWPGKVKWYAKSSGTTNDKSKFIPVSEAGLKNIHYRGGFDSVALYLKNNPKSRLFDGRSLILGGSHSPNYNLRNCAEEADGPAERLRGEAGAYCRGDTASERDEPQWCALVDAVGADSGDGDLGKAEPPGGVA